MPVLVRAGGPGYRPADRRLLDGARGFVGGQDPLAMGDEQARDQVDVH
jgi:hypothetical protein